MEIAGFTKNQTYRFSPVIYADFDLGMSNAYGDKTSYNAVLYNGSKVDIAGFVTLTNDENREVNAGIYRNSGIPNDDGCIFSFLLYNILTVRFINIAFNPPFILITRIVGTLYSAESNYQSKMIYAHM